MTTEERVLKADEWITRHYRTGPKLRDVAKVVGMSMWHMARAYRVRFGTTMKRRIISLQLADAMTRIDKGEPLDIGRRVKTPVTPVWRSVGFRSSSAFRTAFLRQFDKTPSQYRARHGKAA